MNDDVLETCRALTQTKATDILGAMTHGKDRYQIVNPLLAMLHPGGGTKRQSSLLERDKTATNV